MVRSAALAFLILLLSATSAFAGLIRGRVLDPQSKPVANARVLILRGTTILTSAVTDKTGDFGPVEIRAGAYDVTVAVPGLQAAPVHVQIDDRPSHFTAVEIKMTLAAVSDSVVVSAAQVDRPLSRVTDSVTVIDRADLEARQIETASDALRLVPGFNVVASGGRGAITSIFPRGGESDYTLVLVDGIPLNSFGGGFDAAHLSTAGIDRIEVVRGPQSALFGSGAIGGVVNVITRKGGPIRFDGALEGGAQGTSKFSAATSGGSGAWSWGAGVERFASDGDTTFRSSINRKVTNDDYERIVGTAGVAWSGDATRRFRLDARFGRDERGVPGAYGSDPAGTFFGLDTVSRGINKPRGVAASAAIGGASLRHTGQFSYTDTPSLFISPFGDSDDRTRRTAFRYQADHEHARSGYSAGVEAVRERADNTFVTGTVFQPVPVRRTIAGFFGEGRWDVSPRGSVTAGIRAERIARESLEANPSAFGARPAFDTDVVWSTNPKISAAWYLRGDRSSDASKGWTKLRAGAGTGFKPPTVFEIAFTDNPSLKPERSRSADGGVEHVFAGGLVAVDATAFVNHYDDLIVAVKPAWTAASRYRTDNIANARARGVEVGLRLTTTSGLSVRGAYTAMSTRILDVDNATGVPAPYSVGDSLIRRPRHQGSIDARYSRGSVLLFATMNGRGRMSDFEPNFASSVLSNPGYVTFAVGGSVRFRRQLEIYARVTNLANRAYEEALGYPAQARSAMVGLRVAVSR